MSFSSMDVHSRGGYGLLKELHTLYRNKPVKDPRAREFSLIFFLQHWDDSSLIHNGMTL